MQARAHTRTSLAVRGPDSDVDLGAAQTKGRETNSRRNHAALRLLRDWLSDESGYDEEAWPELKRAMENNRRSANRKLFHG